MKTKPTFHAVPFAVVLLLIWGLAGCTKTGGPEKDPNVDYYTCTMHPSVKSQDAKAKCPICSMDLVPVLKKGLQGAGHEHTHGEPTTAEGAASELHEFSVPVERQQQIGVTYAAAKKASLKRSIRSVGMVVPDRTRHWEFVARVEGYVEKLHVTSPGEPVEAGQPLMTIYSPELSTAERELVSLLDTRDRASSAEARTNADRLITAAHRRLEQWNVTSQQITELEKTRQPSEFLTLNSPFKGVVESVPVDQGRKVMIGEHLVDVADLSVVWVWGEFYEDEAALLAKGQKVQVTTKAYPGQTFDGELSLISPFLAEAKRTAKARIDIPNPEFKLKPGMYVNIDLSIAAGEGFTIPVSAVMPTGSRTLVFVDKGEGKLEPRFIQLGHKFGDDYEVASGLAEGERVVASANFLIDAESKVQGAVKSFQEPTPTKPSITTLPAEAGQTLRPLIATYLAIQRSLSADDLAAAAKDIKPLREQVDAVLATKIPTTANSEDYHKKLGALKVAADQSNFDKIEDARVHFGQISAALVVLSDQFALPLEKSLSVIHCPMWDRSPADWLQEGEQIANPFMGAKMAGCGSVVKKLEAAK